MLCEVIMAKIRLDARLSSVASLVREGKVVADIGTDHGYVVAYLINEGICPKAIAADLRKGPLENARQTVAENGIEDKVELILSDGLKNIKENTCEDIVIAGMGGNLIADILSDCSWIYNGELNIVAQPMSHAEVLRKFFADNGFEIQREVTSTDGKHLYCAMSAVYTGLKRDTDISCYYLGKLLENKDDITKAYIDKMLNTLEKKYDALKNAGKEDTDNICDIISQIKMKVTEAYNGNS